jgi:hypothetical protein
MVINAAGFTVDLDKPTLEEQREESRKQLILDIEEILDADNYSNPIFDIEPEKLTTQYESFMTDPRRI